MGLWRVHVQVADQPGQLGQVATVFGDGGANIISVNVVGERAGDGAVTDELLLELPAGVAVTGLVAAAEEAGFRCPVALRTDAASLADPVSTALALARCVTADPGSAAQAVAGLLDADLVAPGATAPPYEVTLQSGSGKLRLGRGWPFTAIEVSQATALLELAGAVRSPQPTPVPAYRAMLVDGSEIVLRTATAADLPLVAALHARCTPQTRALRQLTPGPRLTGPALRDLVGADRPGSAVLAVTVDGGSAVGVADLRAAGDIGTPAIMVEDAWQNRGVGTALMRRLVQLAREAETTQLHATVSSGNLRLTRLMRRAGLRPVAKLDDGLLQVSADLTAVQELDPQPV